MAEFPTPATVSALQSYVAQVCRERGWDASSDLETFLLFMEEVGEMAKEVRKRKKLFLEEGKPAVDELALEMADVLSYLLDLANRWNIDLEAAFRQKEASNAARHWA